VKLIARSDISVLLLGESGSGKEVIARAIHALSARAPGPFVPINCASLAGEILENELFGNGDIGNSCGSDSGRRSGVSCGTGPDVSPHGRVWEAGTRAESLDSGRLTALGVLFRGLRPAW